MIKIDASNVIPKRLGTYLLGIIPGLVFGLSAAYADPALAHQMIERARQIYPFQGYALVVVFLLSCLIVGQTFFLLAWVTDWLIDFLYRAQRYLLLHLTLGSDWLYKAVGRLQGMPPKRNIRHLWRVMYVGSYEENSIRDSPGVEVSAHGSNAAAKAQVWCDSEQGAMGVGRSRMASLAGGLGKGPCGI